MDDENIFYSFIFISNTSDHLLENIFNILSFSVVATSFFRAYDRVRAHKEANGSAEIG